MFEALDVHGGVSAARRLVQQKPKVHASDLDRYFGVPSPAELKARLRGAAAPGAEAAAAPPPQQV